MASYLPKYAVPTDIQFPQTTSKKHPTLQMKALRWHGNQKVTVENVNKPVITESKDAIVRITSTTICGSDLHLYHNEVSGMEDGDIMGHEGMGIVESVGTDVEKIKVGDRVVISAVIAEGKCFYCQNGMFSLCDYTNPSKEMEGIYGHRTAGLFGYSHLTGGYEGCQAEFVRVPFADMTLLKVPNNLPDEKLLGLADTVCTGFHATELGKVQEGQSVAIWGLGPIGLMAAAWCKFKGASRIIGIDCVPSRLECAKFKLGIETINFAESDPVKTLQTFCSGGPDVCIDCVGFRFPKTMLHKIQRAIRLETDDPIVLKECITACRKGGTIAVIGDYFAYANGYPVGAFMEKGLTMSGSQVHIQKYWKQILELIEAGLFDPTFIWTHTMPLEKLEEGYRMFDLKEDGCIKIILKTGMTA